ncbi:hypothetical protein C7212DRAFT_362796 [Tuber magnatum]|uniref:Uncharacterized protein n=1 Tax=Tuber magnatum TaxID=42249 RepID=A0A317STD3_9PEZI|nr:hypothetical protein C7212DRAFT_362796 [Tuber magnatum]
MIILPILQTTFWFLVAFPFLVARSNILPPAHILLNIPPTKFLLFITLDLCANLFYLLNQITRGSLIQLLLIVNTGLILLTLASSIYPRTLVSTHYIPALLTVESNMATSWFTAFLTMHYIGLSSDGEVWRVMRYLRRNHYGALMDCAAACWGVMWVAGALAEWAGVVLYVALAIVDIYQLDWVGDREGRVGQRERFEVWQRCERIILAWRGWAEARAASGSNGEDLEGTGRDTMTERAPAPGSPSEDPASADNPEPVATEAADAPPSSSSAQTEAQVTDTPGEPAPSFP